MADADRQQYAAATGLPGVSGVGRQRTDLHCHNCSRGFVALLDFSVDACNVIVCPRCGHRHFRVIEKGVVTEERWTHRVPELEVGSGSVWVAPGGEGVTCIASLFIRDLWLNAAGGGGEGQL